MELVIGNGSHVPSQPVELPEAQVVTPRTSPTSRVTSLRGEISELIAPWRHSGHKPPFTVGEMAVFALINSDNHDNSREDVHVLSVAEIHASILRTFSYYGELAINGFARLLEEQRHQERVILEEVVEGFPEVLRDFDLPVTITSVSRPDYRTPSEYGITPNAARVFLRRWLEPARAGQFRFLDLSPELRNKIYETLLRFPDTGIDFSEDKGFQLIPGDQKYDTVDPYAGRNSDQFVSNQVCSELLALFRTCKKIHQESSSVFYAINSFRFDTLKGLHSALSAIPPSAQEQMQCLHICMGRGSFRYMESVGNMLQHLAPKRLKFTINSSDCIVGYNITRRYVRKGTNKNKDKEPEEVNAFEMVEELKPFIELARRAEKIEIFEQDSTAFRGFVMRQLAIQHTPSDAVQHGDWMHCTLEA